MASETVLRRLLRIGQGSITAEQGLVALSAVLRGSAASGVAPTLPQVAVNAFVWDTYLKSSQPAFFAEMAPELATSSGPAVAARLGRPAAAAPAVDPAAIREQVKREVAAAILQVC